MNEIALVSANFGGIDSLKVLPAHEGIDCFYYADEPTREKATAEAIASWTQVIVPDYPRHDFDARLRSHYFKQQIHRLDEVRQHRWLVWIDASLLLHETAFILEWARTLSALPPAERCLLVPHPHRKTIREEYEYVTGEIAQGNEDMRVRYEKERMPEQMRYYEARGWNLNERLYCGGFWMVENSDRWARCWDDWWDQNLRFSIMDQLSLPVMLTLHGGQPQSLDVFIWNNRHFKFVFRNGLPGLKL